VKLKLKSILKPTLTLFLVCLIVTGALSVTYNITKDTISAREALEAENGRKNVLPEADTYRKIENIEELQEKSTRLELVKEAYEGLKGGNVEGYVFSVVSKGYGGDIKIMVGIDKDMKITGIKVLSHSETPGLGSKATNEKFLSQMIGIVPKEKLKVVKTKRTKSEEIDTVTSATITSEAVVKAVQAAVDMAAVLKSGV